MSAKKTGAITTFVRTAQGLLLMQLFIALIAVAAAVWAVSEVPKALEERARADEASARAIELVEKSTDVLDLTGTAISALADGNDDLAARSLSQALAAIPLDEDARTPEEKAAWSEMRQTIYKKQIEQAQNFVALDKYGEAAEAYATVWEQLSPENALWPGVTANFAKCLCLSGERGKANEIATADFRRANQQAVRDANLQAACAEQRVPVIRQQVVATASLDTVKNKVSLAYLHIKSETQRASAIEVAQALCSAGYAVPGIELIKGSYPKDGQVRIYYEDQSPVAAQIAGIIQSTWPSPASFREVVFSRKGLPTDRVEVWFPPSGGEAREQGSPRFSCKPQTTVKAPEVRELVVDLNAKESTRRLAAGQKIADAIAAPGRQDETLTSLLDQLEPQSLDKLSASGRFNVLYFLNREADWSDPESAKRLSNALDRIESSQSKSNIIGAQTQDCINSLRTKLKGGKASDRCGGR